LGYYVYRYMLDNKWIYVGKSDHALLSRIKTHKREEKFRPYRNATVEYIRLASRSDMNLTELLLIKTMHPVLNELDSTDGKIPFVYDENILEWTKVDENCQIVDSGQRNITIEQVASMIDKVERSENYCIYSGLMYGTYKIDKRSFYEMLSISPAISPDIIASTLNETFNKNVTSFKKEIQCFYTPQGMFYLHTCTV